MPLWGTAFSACLIAGNVKKVPGDRGGRQGLPVGAAAINKTRQGGFMHREFVFANVLVLALGASCFGQSTFATITGAATDPSGAAVPGVAVEAHEVNTGYVYKVATNES